MNWDATFSIADICGVVSVLAICISLISVSRSNRRLSQSMKLTTLQAMVGEMNNLRQARAENPNLERSLFEARAEWSDTQIQHHLTAVQLANIFEWAYLARRDGLIEKDVWDSWVDTWRSVILASKPLRSAFTESVWTLGRSAEITVQLNALVSGSSAVLDPIRQKKSLWEKIVGI